MDASKFEACIENCNTMISQLSPLSLRAWDMFLRLRRKRQIATGMGGAVWLAILDSEINAKFINEGVPRFLWQPLTNRIEILDAIDVAYLNSTLAAKHKSPPPPPENAKGR